jgi:hypothetical protein
MKKIDETTLIKGIFIRQNKCSGTSNHFNLSPEHGSLPAAQRLEIERDDRRDYSHYRSKTR